MLELPSGESFRQLLRFIIVGLTSNLILFLVYATLVELGLGIQTSMTLCYIIGVINTFYFNKNWTFDFDGRAGWAFFKYVGLYASGYAINVLALQIFVFGLGINHLLVQGVTIVSLAFYFFLISKFIVFRGNHDSV